MVKLDCEQSQQMKKLILFLCLSLASAGLVTYVTADPGGDVGADGATTDPPFDGSPNG